MKFSATRREMAVAGLAAAVLFARSPARAAEGAPAAPTPGVATSLRPRTLSEFAMSSVAGRNYLISVSAPEGPAPAGGFPVIYVLDGHAWFGPAVDIARMRENSRLDPAIIVGVGYSSRRFFDYGRSIDFTPPGARDDRFEASEVGGADLFLEFLLATLKPRISGQYAINPDRETLFGHSLGGLFTLHVLFKAPGSFDTYLAASPSMGFGERVILREAEAFRAPASGPRPNLLVTMGQFESQSVEDRPLAQMADFRRWYEAHPEARPGQTADQAVEESFPPPDPAFDRVEAARAMTGRLAAAGVRAVFAEFEGEEHSSAAISALNRGVPFALRPAS